jgi:pimeloyl-ACP methyl ester carboxylesterase
MRAVFADILGAKTRYYTGGAGKPVMLIHGVGMSADSWLRTIPGLEKSFAVTAPDVLDNGFTEAGPYRGGPPQPYMVDHLVALADHLKLDKFSVVGSSLGSGLATLLYLKVPDRIEKIVFVGPGAVIDKPEALAKVYEASDKNGRAAVADPTYESCRARVQRVVFDPACVPEALVAMQMTMYALPNAMEVFDRRMKGLRDPRGLQDYEVYSKLEQVKIPALVIIGREDIRGDYDASVAAAKRLPQGKILTYEKCGHWPHMEHPERFNADLAAFLA